MKLLINVTLNVTPGSSSFKDFHKSEVIATEVALSRFDDWDTEYAMRKLEPLIKKSLGKIIDETEAYAPKQLILPGFDWV